MEATIESGSARFVHGELTSRILGCAIDVHRELGPGMLESTYRICLVDQLRSAVENILPVHEAQVLSYLKFLKLRVGLLLNFNVPSLRQGMKRFVR